MIDRDELHRLRDTLRTGGCDDRTLSDVALQLHRMVDPTHQQVIDTLLTSDVVYDPSQLELELINVIEDCL